MTNPSNPKIDAVLPLRMRDYERFRIQEVSLRKFFADLGTLWIVVPDAEVATFRSLIQYEQYKVISEIALVPEFAAFPEKTNEFGGWFKQQLIKLAITPKITTAFYIALDADIIWTKPVHYSDLVKNGRAGCFIWNSDGASDSDMFAEWYEWAEKVLHLKSPRQQPKRNMVHNVTPVVLCKEAVIRLQTYLSEICPAPFIAMKHSQSKIIASAFSTQSFYTPPLTNWRIYLLFSLPWTEYALYFTFLEAQALFSQYYVETDYGLHDARSVWYLKDLANWDVNKLFIDNEHSFCFIIQSNTNIDPELIWNKVKPYLLPETRTLNPSPLKNMKIWILTNELPANVTGGIARYVDNYARLLGERGHDVTLIAITPNTYEQDYAPGVKLFGIQQGHPTHTELLRFPQARQNLIKRLNTAFTWGPDQSYLLAEATIELLKRLPPPDIIEVQEAGAMPYFLLQRKLTEFGPLQQIPVLVHLHTSLFDFWRINNDPIYRLPEYWITQMEKFSIAAADGLLCPSHYLADHVAKTCNPPLNTKVIPLPSYLPESVLQQTSPPEPRHLMYFGRLEVRKGVLPLIAACDDLWANGEAFKLTLIGRNTNHSIYGETVGEHVRKHYANHIEAGRLVLQAPSYSFADLMQHIQKAWAVIVPSLFENFPNTCMEAMSLGQVVLASTNGGQAEMIERDGVNGFLFDWAVPGQLQAQLLRILGLSDSDREQIGQRARTRIATMCDPDIIIPQRLAHYQHIIDTHSQKRHFPTVHVAPAVAIPDAQVKTQSIAMQKDLLSIVICSNEAGQTLYQLILNALASNYGPKEVIVAYPAQLDLAPLRQRFAALEVDLSAVKLMPMSSDIWQQAPKQAKLREALANCVSGEFITFWTENESVALDFCARAIAVLKQYDNVAIVYAWTETDHTHRPIRPAWNTEFPLQLAHNMVPDVLLARRDIYIQSSQGQSKTGMDDSQMRDHERWINMLERNYIGVCLPHPLIRSSTHEKNAATLQENLQSALAHTTLRSRHMASFEMYAPTLFELSNANGPVYNWQHIGENDGYHEFDRLHELLERKAPITIKLEQVQTDAPITTPKIEQTQPDLPLDQVLVPKDKIYLPVPTRWRDLLRTLIILLPGVFTSRYAKLRNQLGWSAKTKTSDIPEKNVSPPTIKPAPVLKTNPSVAVVIPTAGTFDITNTLQALTAQSYLAQDIIVVESAGVSQSARDFLSQYQHQPGKNPALRILFEPRPRANIARNTGIKASSAQIIALTDDDVIPDQDWLKAFVTALETRPEGPFNGVVGGKVNLCYQMPKPAWCVGLFEAYLAKFDRGQDSHLLRAHDYLVSASMAFYRTTYDVLGEFSEMEMGRGNQTINDEHIFLDAAERKADGLLYCADAVAQHQIPLHRITMEYFVKRAQIQGAADVALRYYLDQNKSKSGGLGFLKSSMGYSYASMQSLNNDGLTEVTSDHEDEFIENLLLMRIAYLNGVCAGYKQYFENAT